MSGEHYHGWRGVPPDSVVSEMADKIMAEAPQCDGSQLATRTAFAKLLRKVANAMHELGYVDSCDTTWGPESLKTLFSLIGPKERLTATIEMAEEAAAVLRFQIERSKGMR